MSYHHVPLSIADKIGSELMGNDSVVITGAISRAVLANAVLKNQANAPQIIVCPNDEESLAIRDELLFFSPESHVCVLSGYDVSPYSSLLPRPSLSSDRVRWLAAATSSHPPLLIASLPGLMQKTFEKSVFQRHSYTLRIGDELDADFYELLGLAGYKQVDTVENCGEFAVRGGILDIYSSAHDEAVRIELFGDEIESLRHFDVENQLSTGPIELLALAPAHELLYSECDIETMLGRVREHIDERECESSEKDFLLRSLVQEKRFPGLEFVLPFFYETLANPADFLPKNAQIWWYDKLECDRSYDILIETLRDESRSSHAVPIAPNVDQYYELEFHRGTRKEVIFQKIALNDPQAHVPYSVSHVAELKLLHQQNVEVKSSQKDKPTNRVRHQIELWREDYRIAIAVRNENQSSRIRFMFEDSDVPIKLVEGDFDWNDFLHDRENSLWIIPRSLTESVRLPEEKLIFLREEDLLSKKGGKRNIRSTERFQKDAEKLSFGDLKAGDHVVHSEHGIGIYEGLKVMTINDIDCEFLQLQYKGSDKLYLPVHRLNHLRRYSGSDVQQSLDKLGGTSFEKTKIKVKAKLRDIASELLNLYAKRAQIQRPSYDRDNGATMRFEASFPYDETDDQLDAVSAIYNDLSEPKPMDRLVCGDVGFGKTEVAMRAAFQVAQAGYQVAVLAPTTVLTFQHLETFTKRFKSWPFRIRALNRFVPRSEQKEILAELAEGKVDIIIGTHRLLSQDIKFKELGLLILDEEQKFGVAHKEKIRKFRAEIDTLALSATPIPRTLNLSFVGVRDMSLITTPPVDRVPTRTFVCKFERETIRKAILAEVQRGGQIYFIHNRIQSIYGLADELRELVPEVRMRIGHGQMKEDELEKTMTAFFKHEFDMLLCTTIVESGMDVSSANTMFIDQAQNYGLSQLYQLRGRVGRSKQRAYCYLLIPDRKKLDKQAQERLRVLQENTALGSGIRVAHYDLELRGAGDILGYDQAGHINAVGYELYMELLDQAIHELKGEPESLKQIEPEVDLRIPALIPDQYIKDIRTRLYYYKAFNDIDDTEDVDKYEDELRDQFGKLPESVINLLGVMLIKSVCKKIGVLELKAGSKFVSLKLAENTPLSIDRLVQLATMENKKYAITPDSRLKIRINEISWPRVFEEIDYLRQQV